ncbi:MAG TPA: GntR family transcriptional regulator [Terriglobales bacterium]|nr:GntR family transcriptional regulator [Terriglobales bacterium]
MTAFRRAKKPWRGVPSLIPIERESAQPLYQQIYESFRARITGGDLQAGQSVPSTRELARELGISR